ncbi:MAG: DNA methylase [bacterium]|nr:DNA methylase [bacterium]MDY4634858.1 DNA methylase [Candidatus Limivicinus sp.]
MGDRTYIAIDLKSFYASVECVERGLDPLDTCLVVADSSRTEKTICLAVTPPLKAYGISGRARLFEVVQQVKTENARRRGRFRGGDFTGKSCLASELALDPHLELDYIVAQPRMAHYIDYSTRVYNIYTRYVAPEDIHVYSIDEVFMDATDYLKTRGISAHDFARMIISDVLHETGITATAGIGSNLYLCKVAMDIRAKRVPADRDGVRIAALDEESYRRLLWGHQPLTDFWRVGRGYARKLEAVGLRTMGDIARCSLGGANEYYNEELLYKLFGVNAQLLIDHAWGWEPCTIRDIKAYRPESSSISVGQVLQGPYDFAGGKMILREMTDGLVLDLVDQGLVTNQIVLTVGYDRDNPESGYAGETQMDAYGRQLPKAAHGSSNLGCHTSSTRQIMDAAMALYDRIVDQKLPVRRMYVVAANVMRSGDVQEPETEQLDLFTDYEQRSRQREEERAALARERNKQRAMLAIKKKYGKNAILPGTSYQEGATGRDRNRQIGGHRA